MKRSLFALLFVAIIAAVAFSQYSTNAQVSDLRPSGRVVEFQCTILTTTAYNSNAFSLSGYIGENLSTYPIAVSYSLDTSNVNAGTEIDSAAVTIQGSNDETNWLVVDTLSVTLGTTAYTSTTMNLNNTKFAYYRVRAVGLGSNTAAVLKLAIYAYRRDGNP